MPVLIKPVLVAAAAAALANWLGVPTDAHRATSSTLTAKRTHLDATSDAEARQMRRATHLLAREVAAAAHCNPAVTPARYQPCVLPALRHAGIGGPTGARLLNVVIESVPFGRCRGYLLGLQAALDGAGEDARYLLPKLYEPGRPHAQHEIAGQLALIAHTLRHAGRSAAADVCSPGAAMPAA
jgi:hypothetical protein